MEAQHKVFPVGSGRDALAVHVWVSMAGVQIEIHGRHPLPCPVIRFPPRDARGWSEIATICQGVGTGERRRWSGLGVSQGKTADLVGWSVGPPSENITVTLPRDTWVAICEWVAETLADEGRAHATRTSPRDPSVDDGLQG